jgi:hypothetical protein
MKKILIFLVLSLSISVAFAHPNGRNGYNGGGGYNGGNYYRGGNYTYHNNNCCGWVAPVIIGGVVGAIIAAPYYYPPPQIYAQPPTVLENGCQYPFIPSYNKIYTIDRFGNNVETYQFIGCK